MNNRINRPIRKVLGACVITWSVVLSACSAQPQSQPTPPSSLTPTPPSAIEAADSSGGVRRAIETGPVVVADGYVMPNETATIRFDMVGIISDVYVREGDVVKAGDLLARIDTRQLELVVEEAKARLARAQVINVMLQKGPSEEDISKAKAALVKAQAELRRAQGAVTQADIQAAERTLLATREALVELQRGAKPEDIRIAEAAIAEDRAALQTTRDHMSAEKLRARSRVEQTTNYLRDAQAVYSRIYWRNQQKTGVELSQQEIDQEAAALREVENIQEALFQELSKYEEALKAELTEIAVSESQLHDSEQRLAKLKRGADPDELAAAQARVAAAEASLTKLQGEQRAGQLEVAQAEVTYAEADLEALLAQPNPSDLAIAESDLREAEVAIKQAELLLARASMVAPMSGVVAEVTFREGDPSDAAQVVIADYSVWKVVTRNLTELGVVRIREGDPARVALYALPGVALTGKVVEIRQIGNTEGGKEVSYEVVVQLDQGHEQLRWNLTASVSIDPSS
jgi:HlyD family secretion protein